MRDFINKLGNIFMKPLLRSPLHFFASAHVILIIFTGRKSGKVYTTPVEYMREGDCLTVFTQRGRMWWKNLQGGAIVTVRLRGGDISGVAQTITDETTIMAAFTRMHPKIVTAQAPDFAASTVMVQIGLWEAVERYMLSHS